jgi:hypothetical protein
MVPMPRNGIHLICGMWRSSGKSWMKVNRVIYSLWYGFVSVLRALVWKDRVVYSTWVSSQTVSTAERWYCCNWAWYSPLGEIVGDGPTYIVEYHAEELSAVCCGVWETSGE